MVVVSPDDWDSVASEIGETVTVYNPTRTTSSDYGSIATNTQGTGTTETAIFQPITEKKMWLADGNFTSDDVFVEFKHDTVAVKDSQIKRADNKYYTVVWIKEVTVGGVVHHYEGNLKFAYT